MFLPASAPLPASRRIAAPDHHSALLAAWPLVRIGAIETPRVHRRQESRFPIAACIDLGGLLPVDVRVTLVPPPDRMEAGERRMFSVQSYANRLFRFATSIDAALLDGDGEWIVRVTPAAARLGEGCGVEPVIRRIVPRLEGGQDALERQSAHPAE